MDEILSLLDQRRELLMERLDLILAAERRGDSGSTWIEVELLADEMAFLRELYLGLLAPTTR